MENLIKAEKKEKEISLIQKKVNFFINSSYCKMLHDLDNIVAKFKLIRENFKKIIRNK